MKSNNPEIIMPNYKTEDPKKIVNAVKACPWRVGVGNFFVCGCNNFSVCDIDQHTYSGMPFCPCMATITLG